MPRPKFSLKTLLWLMAVVAAFCTGIRFERYSAERRADGIRSRIITDSDFDWRPLPSPTMAATQE